MYSFPSASKMREPSPRAIKSGDPPTPRKARTGELTPPGINFWAQAKRSSDFWCCIARLRSAEHSEKLGERIEEAIDHPLFQRDDGVVGDSDALRAHLGAALGDVAVADALLFAKVRDAVFSVQRIHFERGDIDQEARTDEFVVLVVIAQHVTDVLAQEALDALAKFL